MSIPTLPKGIVLLENQVAGHTFQDSAEAIGMLKSTEEGNVFKPLTKPMCAEREKNFYEMISKCIESSLLMELKSMVPEYNKTVMMNVRGRDVHLLNKFSDFLYFKMIFNIFRLNS